MSLKKHLPSYRARKLFRILCLNLTRPSRADHSVLSFSLDSQPHSTISISFCNLLLLYFFFLNSSFGLFLNLTRQCCSYSSLFSCHSLVTFARRATLRHNECDPLESLVAVRRLVMYECMYDYLFIFFREFFFSRETRDNPVRSPDDGGLPVALLPRARSHDTLNRGGALGACAKFPDLRSALTIQPALRPLPPLFPSPPTLFRSASERHGRTVDAQSISAG